MSLRATKNPDLDLMVQANSFKKLTVSGTTTRARNQSFGKESKEAKVFKEAKERECKDYQEEDDGDNNATTTASVKRTSLCKESKATRCYRPKEWNPEVEEAFRVQQTGWRDLKEYVEAYGEPERWANGFIRCTRVKSNGYYTYWRGYRECDDKYLHLVKVFEYA